MLTEIIKEPKHVIATVDKFLDIERLAWLNNKHRQSLRSPHKGDLQMLDLLRLGYEPDEHVLWSKGNLLLNAGINRAGSLLIAGGGQGMDNAHCALGTGDGSTAVAATDTDLSAAAGSTHRWFNMADSTWPTFATQVLTVKSTFASADGNYNWLEWGLCLATASANTVTAPLYNRKVPASSLGTKSSGSTFALTISITMS